MRIRRSIKIWHRDKTRNTIVDCSKQAKMNSEQRHEPEASVEDPRGCGRLWSTRLWGDRKPVLITPASAALLVALQGEAMWQLFGFIGIQSCAVAVKGQKLTSEQSLVVVEGVRLLPGTSRVPMVSRPRWPTTEAFVPWCSKCARQGEANEPQKSWLCTSTRRPGGIGPREPATSGVVTVAMRHISLDRLGDNKYDRRRQR